MTTRCQYGTAIDKHQYNGLLNKERVKKKKSSPYNKPRRTCGGVEVWLDSYFNLDAILGWVVNATHGLLYPREINPPCKGRPKAGKDGCGKSRPKPGFDPLASRYTDYAIPSQNS